MSALAAGHRWTPLSIRSFAHGYCLLERVRSTAILWKKIALLYDLCRLDGSARILDENEAPFVERSKNASRPKPARQFKDRCNRALVKQGLTCRRTMAA